VVKTREVVKSILEESEKARNDDIFLVYAFYIHKYASADLGYFLATGMKVESPENILRHRRYWQNTMGVCKADEKIQAERRMQERKWRRDLSTMREEY